MFRLLLTVALLGGVSFMAAEAEDAPKEVSAEITGHIFGKQIQRRQDEAVGATESRHRAEISQARETLAETLPHSWTAQNQASARAFQEADGADSVRCEVESMRKVSEYEAHAEECRRMAEQMNKAEHKQQLTQMAETWEMLAKARAKQLKRFGDSPESR